MAFPDLRIHRAGLREEGFWPSFTDIMMVIVMIFLMAMLGLLLRNMDLVAELKLALSDAQHASQQVKQTSSANQDLSTRLAQSEHDLEMMRMQLMDVSGQRKTLDQQLLQAKRDGASWQQKTETLQRSRQQLLADAKVQRGVALALRQQLQKNRAAADDQAQLSAQKLQQQEADLAQMRSALADQSVQVTQMRDSYSELESKYRHLIRPARSRLGKVVVTVRYIRRDQQLKAAIQPPDQNQFVDVDNVQLHQMLSQLKTKFNHKLYVRIIFPTDSGLSYNEAWRITESLLRLYDYYY